jgi:hypothetical protein
MNDARLTELAHRATEYHQRARLARLLAAEEWSPCPDCAAPVRVDRFTGDTLEPSAFGTLYHFCPARRRPAVILDLEPLRRDLGLPLEP